MSSQPDLGVPPKLSATPSRTRRFVRGLGFGYLHTAVVTFVALWLTPYLLEHLGQTHYGLWLVGAQVLGYLALMDLGVVALLPREVAYATGRPADACSAELRRLMGATARIVLLQTPFVALAGLTVWCLIPNEWSALEWPLAIVLLTFVVAFPLRIFQAVLQGLQELAFLGSTQLTAWLAGTVLTVLLVEAGAGLYALAAGWAGTQILSALLAWRRLASRFPDAIPRELPPLSRSDARTQLGQGMWISVSQVAQVLRHGTELVVIGKLMGPAAVVTYACTGKLVTLLANQPQLFMQMAMPALCELRGVSQERVFRVSSAMSQAMLIGSGAIVCVTLAVNRPFVTWWVGRDQFAGMGLTVLLLTAMLLRHWNVAATYTLFCFGRERRLAITGVLDGLVTLGSMLVLVPFLGSYGAVLGTLVGVCSVSLPGNLLALAREEGVGLIDSLRPLGPWFLRFTLIIALVATAISVWAVQGIWAAVLLGALVAVGYFVLMIPIALAPPLGSLLTPRVQPWIAFVPSRFRRLAAQPTP